MRKIEQKIKNISFYLINSWLNAIEIVKKINEFLWSRLVFKKKILHFLSGDFHIVECRVSSLHNAFSLDNAHSMWTYPISKVTLDFCTKKGTCLGMSRYTIITVKYRGMHALINHLHLMKGPLNVPGHTYWSSSVLR